MNVHLRLSDLVITLERQRDASLQDRPVVVGGSPASPGTVMAASHEARRAGVAVGQPLAAARSCCPDAAFVPGNVEAYVDAAARAFEIARGASPCVDWDGLHEGCLGVRASASVSARTVAEGIRAEIAAELGVKVACGLAATRIAARVAAHLVGPSGVLVVLPGYEPRFLESVDVALLEGVDAVLLERLRGAGVDTIGSVAELAAQPARARGLLGRCAPVLLRLARGDDPRTVPSGGAPARLVRVLGFGDETLPGTREAVLADTVAELAAVLTRYDWRASALEVEARSRDGRSRHAGAALPAGAPRPPALVAVAQHAWDRLPARSVAPCRVTVRLRGVRPAPRFDRELPATSASRGHGLLFPLRRVGS